MYQNYMTIQKQMEDLIMTKTNEKEIKIRQAQERAIKKIIKLMILTVAVFILATICTITLFFLPMIICLGRDLLEVFVMFGWFLPLSFAPYIFFFSDYMKGYFRKTLNSILDKMYRQIKVQEQLEMKHIKNNLKDVI
jgi:hypothetical protein